MAHEQIDAINQLTEMVKMLGNGSSTGLSYTGEDTDRPMGAIEGLVIAMRDMRAEQAQEAGDLNDRIDRLTCAIEDQTEAHREMTEYLARAIDSRK